MASSNGKNGANGKDKTRMAGNLDLTGFTRNIRGGGFGLTYSGTRPQTGGTATYGGGGGGNYIDFKPIISQVASPAIQAVGGDIISEKGKGGVTTESGKGGVTKVVGEKDKGKGRLPAIGSTDFDPSDYGNRGLGMKDYRELKDRGYGDKRIAKYAEKSGLRIGSKLQDQLGLGGAGTGGEAGKDSGVFRGPTTTYAPGVSLSAKNEETKAPSEVRVKDLGLGSLRGTSAAKDLLASFRGITGGTGAKKAENISDQRIDRLLGQAGIEDFGGRKDAKAFTSFLAGRAEDKAKRVESAQDKVKAANQRWRQGEGSNVIKTIKQEVKAATGKRPTTAEVSQLVSKAKVGKNLGAADVKKVVRAAKKAKSFKRGGGKRGKKN